MAEEKRRIFLDDGSIFPWERPARSGYTEGPEILVDICLWSTRLVEQVGFELMDEEAGPFRVVASAAKYLVDLARMKHREKGVTNEPKRELLFSGGMTVYRKGEIPGTKLQGYDFERKDRIWFATAPEKRFLDSGGLKHLIFGDEPNQIGRIEAILEGYRTQDENDRRAESRRVHEYWKLGQEAGESGRWLDG